MSNLASPFGMKPAQPLSGTLRQREGVIASGYNTDIHQYDPIGIVAGVIEVVTPTTSASTGGIVGAFMGVEYTGADGRRAVANNWTANLVATDIVAYYTLGTDIIYEMQAVGSLAQSAVGGLYNPSAAGGGSSITGLSNLSAVAAANGALRLIGINPAPDNVPGDAFTIGQFMLNKFQFGAIQAATA